MYSYDAAYLAGIIDGEGSIFIRGTGSVALILSLGTTDKCLMDWCVKHCGVKTLVYEVRRRGIKSHYQKAWYIMWQGYRAKRLLSKCCKYMVIKKDRALIVVNEWPAKGVRAPKIKADIRDRIHKLNHKIKEV